MRGKTTSVTSLWAESCGEGKGQEEKGKKERNRGKLLAPCDEKECVLSHSAINYYSAIHPVITVEF